MGIGVQDLMALVGQFAGQLEGKGVADVIVD